MEQLRGRVTPPTYNTTSQDKKYNDEYHQDNGGRYWCFIVKNSDRGKGPSFPALVDVACTTMK